MEVSFANIIELNGGFSSNGADSQSYLGPSMPHFLDSEAEVSCHDRELLGPCLGRFEAVPWLHLWLVKDS